MRRIMAALVFAVFFPYSALWAHPESECGKKDCDKTCEMPHCEGGSEGYDRLLCSMERSDCQMERLICELSNLKSERANFNESFRSTFSGKDTPVPFPGKRSR